MLFSIGTGRSNGLTLTQVGKLTPLQSHPRVSDLIKEFKSNDAIHWCSNRH